MKGAIRERRQAVKVEFVVLKRLPARPRRDVFAGIKRRWPTSRSSGGLWRGGRRAARRSYDRRRRRRREVNQSTHEKRLKSQMVAGAPFLDEVVVWWARINAPVLQR